MNGGGLSLCGPKSRWATAPSAKFVVDKIVGQDRSSNVESETARGLWWRVIYGPLWQDGEGGAAAVRSRKDDQCSVAICRDRGRTLGQAKVRLKE